MDVTEEYRNGWRIRAMFDGKLPQHGDDQLLAMIKGALKLPLTASWGEVEKAFADLQVKNQG